MCPIAVLYASLKHVLLQEAAKDVIAQEAIAEEVKKFMANSGSMQEDDLLKLEEVIRLRLSGRTPPYAPMPHGHSDFNTLALGVIKCDE